MSGSVRHQAGPGTVPLFVSRTDRPSGLQTGVVRCLVPPDVVAGGPWCGECQGVFDGDAVGVGLDGDVGGLADMREADLDARWPPITMASRDDTRRLTIWGSGSRGRPGWPGRAPRRRSRSCPGMGQATVRVRVPRDPSFTAPFT